MKPYSNLDLTGFKNLLGLVIMAICASKFHLISINQHYKILC